jgi:hypothetical protein
MLGSSLRSIGTVSTVVALLASCQASRTIVASDVPGSTSPPRDEGEETYEWERFELGIGAQLVATVDTTLRVDSPTLGVGTEMDLESDFNVDDRLFLGRVDADWRFAKRHALDFSAFKISREGTRVIDRDIQIGDVVFPIDTQVTNESDMLMIKLAYRYAFLYRPRWHLGASLGAHTVNWKSSWTAGALALDEEFDYTIPLPVLGMFASYAITPRLFLDASSEFFGLEFEEYEGFVNNTRLNLEHRTFEHLGFGVGLDYFLVNVSAESESGHLRAETEFDYVGILGYVRVF